METILMIRKKIVNGKVILNFEVKDSLKDLRTSEKYLKGCEWLPYFSTYCIRPNLHTLPGKLEIVSNINAHVHFRASPIESIPLPKVFGQKIAVTNVRADSTSSEETLWADINKTTEGTEGGIEN